MMKQKLKPDLTAMIVERIAEHNDLDPADPGFSLYEYVDTEALGILFESTDGPLSAEFRVDGVTVTVETDGSGTPTVEVEPVQ